jgi:hypothetical protein
MRPSRASGTDHPAVGSAGPRTVTRVSPASGQVEQELVPGVEVMSEASTPPHRWYGSGPVIATTQARDRSALREEPGHLRSRAREEGERVATRDVAPVDRVSAKVPAVSLRGSCVSAPPRRHLPTSPGAVNEGGGNGERRGRAGPSSLLAPRISAGTGPVPARIADHLGTTMTVANASTIPGCGSALTWRSAGPRPGCDGPRRDRLAHALAERDPGSGGTCASIRIPIPDPPHARGRHDDLDATIADQPGPRLPAQHGRDRSRSTLGGWSPTQTVIPRSSSAYRSRGPGRRASSSERDAPATQGDQAAAVHAVRSTRRPRAPGKGVGDDRVTQANLLAGDGRILVYRGSGRLWDPAAH